MVANIKLLLSIVNFEQTKAEVQVGSSKGDNCKNLIKAHSLVFYFVVFYVNSDELCCKVQLSDHFYSN